MNGPYNYQKQVKAVLIAEIGLIAVAFGIAWVFWSTLCPAGIESCLGKDWMLRPLVFLVLATVRPFVFTPFFFVTIIAGRAFGPELGTLLAALGGVLSSLCVFGVVKLLGGSVVKPWLRSNLPATSKFLQSQDYKIVIALRLIPLIPFDLTSILFGVLGFRNRVVMICTFLAVIPECYVFSRIVDPSNSMLRTAILSLTVFAASMIGPLVILELITRRRGRGLLSMMRASISEIKYEIQANNEIMRSDRFDSQKIPVLLLYGFFSSRRSVTVLEKMLRARGHQVLSFNLGGLFNTFFTRDILETAGFIDTKIKRQVERHGFQKIHIVAHSKGGLVALWWLLALGGSRFCDKVITMGTPFRGSRLTYLALLTPLGLFWRDVGQMRPGSTFLKALHRSPIPDHLKIYCFYSRSDRVAKDEAGIFRPHAPQASADSLQAQDTLGVIPIPLHHISHFEFLYKKEVARKISQILGDETSATDRGIQNSQTATAVALEKVYGNESNEESTSNVSDTEEPVWRQIAGDD